MNEAVSLWNYMSWVDGILLTMWLGMMYYVKCWIDNKFKGK